MTLRAAQAILRDKKEKKGTERRRKEKEGVFAAIFCVWNRKCFSLFLSSPHLYSILLY
jgi:hypothetical protein